MSLLENLTIKDEKTLNISNYISYNSKNIENNYLLLNNEKIIVYNLGNKYLIPMIIINKKKKIIINNESINNNYFVNLNFINEENLNEIVGEEIKINLNDIYFEKINSFYFKENFTEIKILNDLSLLYNIKKAKLNNKIFSIVNKMILMYDINDKIKILINYIFKESKDFNNTFFYQKYINYIFDNYDFEFIDYIIETFLIYNCQQYKIIKVIIYIIQLFYFIKNLNFFLKIDKKIMLFPFFSFNNLILNNKSILFSLKKINKIKYYNEENIKNIIYYNFKDLLFYNENKIFIYIIYRIFCDFLKNEKLFINVISLLYISYLHYLKNNIFYSNITILCLFIYINNLFVINKEIKNILIFLFLNNNNEDDIFIISDLIKDNIINNELNKNSLINSFLYYFTINIKYYINNNYKKFKEYIIQIESKFNLNFLKINNKNNIIKNSNYNSIILDFFNEYIYYNKEKLKFKTNLYILNDISLIFKKNNFNLFLSNFDIIPKFLKITNILNLTKYYQKNNNVDNLIIKISKFNDKVFYNKILLIQNFLKFKKINNYIKKLRKNSIIIQRYFRKHFYNKILKNNNNILIKYINKYKQIDSLIYNILLYYKKSLNNFIEENKKIKSLIKINEKRNKKNSFKDIYTNDINNVNKKDYINNEKNNYLLNYKKLINSSENYLFKIKKLINIIYSNEEIKKVLNKYGIDLI